MGNDGLVPALFVNLGLPALTFAFANTSFSSQAQGVQEFGKGHSDNSFYRLRQKCSQFPQCSLLKGEKIFL